jgi:hypothetical protein
MGNVNSAAQGTADSAQGGLRPDVAVWMEDRGLSDIAEKFRDRLQSFTLEVLMRRTLKDVMYVFSEDSEAAERVWAAMEDTREDAKLSPVQHVVRKLQQANEVEKQSAKGRGIDDKIEGGGTYTRQGGLKVFRLPPVPLGVVAAEDHPARLQDFAECFVLPTRHLDAYGSIYSHLVENVLVSDKQEISFLLTADVCPAHVSVRLGDTVIEIMSNGLVSILPFPVWKAHRIFTIVSGVTPYSNRYAGISKSMFANFLSLQNGSALERCCPCKNRARKFIDHARDLKGPLRGPFGKLEDMLESLKQFCQTGKMTVPVTERGPVRTFKIISHRQLDSKLESLQVKTLLHADRKLQLRFKFYDRVLWYVYTGESRVRDLTLC